MVAPLNASAITAGTLMSNSNFVVPPYQREYAWEEDEVSEFWKDLSQGLGNEEPYFLGLVIVTDDGDSKQVVDGQQRILTLTLLAAALFHEANLNGRGALAERIQATFLSSIDYETDDTNPRVTLSDATDNSTLQSILDSGQADSEVTCDESELYSHHIREAFQFLCTELHKDLSEDPFKRLGNWTDFLTNRLYFAVFVHPDSASAYRVFEIINTRGKELTTADLLKNYILSQTADSKKNETYKRWQSMAQQFGQGGANSVVQFIRHVVTVQGGHILPKDLFDFLAQRITIKDWKAPTADKLMSLLEKSLPLYLQMTDPTLDGPAEADALKIFAALNDLGVISVRPILLAMSEAPESLSGMRYVLSLVVRRIVSGNLGTGNVERKFGEAAKLVNTKNNWTAAIDELEDLNPTREEFVEQLKKRSYNKSVLTFLRRSIVSTSIAPSDLGTLHFIRPRHSAEWIGFDDESADFWATTVGNTFLSTQTRRLKSAVDWASFKTTMLPTAIPGEWKSRLEQIDAWNATAVETMGNELAIAAGKIWFPNEPANS